MFFCRGLASAAIAASAFASDCVPCVGCSDPCASTSGSVVVAGSGCGAASVAMGCGEAVAVAPAVESLCEQLTTYKVVMEPTYVTETRAVSGTETRTETHQRTKKVYTSVPVTVTRYDSVAEDVVEEYTVSVPVCVMKEVQVQVCKMVPRLVEEVINPCAAGASSSGSSVAPMTGSGCGSAAGCGAVSDGGCGGCGAAATPVSTGCGCN